MGQCMGCAPKKNKVDEALNRRNKVIRILLLGVGESGKTTVMKQMVLKYGQGFDESFKRQQKPLALANLVEGAHVLIQGGRNSKYRLTDPKSVEAAKLVKNYYANNMSDSDVAVAELDPAFVDAMKVLIEDPNFNKTLEESSKYQLPDGWRYFMGKVKDFPIWGGKDWLPDTEDILHVRARTSGINRKLLVYKNPQLELDINLEVIDVGGQANERTKWIRVFNEVHSILFMQSMSDYDQIMFEQNKNRLEDSIEVWSKHTRLDEFLTTSFILFLNKRDLLEEKFCRKRISINDHYSDPQFTPAPEYNENLDEKENMLVVEQWFKDYMTFKAPEYKREEIHIHCTSAVQTDIMGPIIALTMANFLSKVLDLGGFMGN